MSSFGGKLKQMVDQMWRISVKPVPGCLEGVLGHWASNLNSFPVEAVWEWREGNFAILPLLLGQIV